MDFLMSALSQIAFLFGFIAIGFALAKGKLLPEDSATLFNMSETADICALCSLAMPLGLNTIVIPSALGKDTSVAAGMAIVSHLLSALTIPLIFAII